MLPFDRGGVWKDDTDKRAPFAIIYLLFLIMKKDPGINWHNVTNKTRFIIDRLQCWERTFLTSLYHTWSSKRWSTLQLLCRSESDHLQARIQTIHHLRHCGGGGLISPSDTDLIPHETIVHISLTFRHCAARYEWKKKTLGYDFKWMNKRKIFLNDFSLYVISLSSDLQKHVSEFTVSLKITKRNTHIFIWKGWDNTVFIRLSYKE